MLSRNLEKAREAYEQKNLTAVKLAHQQHPMRSREVHRLTEGRYLKSIVYGGLDGTITTFAVVAGVTGADLSSAVVLILGFANLIADGISMSTGDYLSSKAEKEYAQAEMERERWEVENYPEGEKQETIELYLAKGISKPDSEKMAEIISKYKQPWVDMMMVNELGILRKEQSPIKNAVATFCSFVIFGFLPVLSYVIAKIFPNAQTHTFLTACLLTGAVLFALGSLKTFITAKNWFRSGLEMLIIGGLAATAAYAIGVLLSQIA